MVTYHCNACLTINAFRTMPHSICMYFWFDTSQKIDWLLDWLIDKLQIKHVVRRRPCGNSVQLFPRLWWHRQGWEWIRGKEKSTESYRQAGQRSPGNPYITRPRVACLEAGFICIAVLSRLSLIYSGGGRREEREEREIDHQRGPLSPPFSRSSIPSATGLPAPFTCFVLHVP